MFLFRKPTMKTSSFWILRHAERVDETEEVCSQLCVVRSFGRRMPTRLQIGAALRGCDQLVMPSLFTGASVGGSDAPESTLRSAHYCTRSSSSYRGRVGAEDDAAHHRTHLRVATDSVHSDCIGRGSRVGHGGVCRRVRDGLSLGGCEEWCACGYVCDREQSVTVVAGLSQCAAYIARVGLDK